MCKTEDTRISKTSQILCDFTYMWALKEQINKHKKRTVTEKKEAVIWVKDGKRKQTGEGD